MSMRDMTLDEKLEIMSRLDPETANSLILLLTIGKEYDYEFFVEYAITKIKLYNSVEGWKAELMSKTIGAVKKERSVTSGLKRLFHIGKEQDQEKEM
jgi:hypothetical protein